MPPCSAYWPILRPVAFGALGTPISALQTVTGINELRLSAMAGRQLPFFSLIVPAWLCGRWPAGAASSVFGRRSRSPAAASPVVQFLVSNLHGPWLVDIAAGVVSLVSVVVLLRSGNRKRDGSTSTTAASAAKR